MDNQVTLTLPPYACDLHAYDSASTIIDVLQWRAKNEGERIAYTFLRDSGSGEENISYGELDQEARAIAALLQDLGLPGQRALLLLPSGLDYIKAFFACLYAGVMAVPGFPISLGRLRQREPWFRAVMRDAQPRAAFATPEMIARIRSQAQADPALINVQWIAVQDANPKHATRWRPSPISADTVAFLQYTSGSTSTPKGVMVTHGNILHNQRVIQTAYGQNRDSTVVSWLPLYHDMGLIGTVLQCVYVGSRAVLMAPAKFFQDPMSWLKAISCYRASSSSAPNFAYELCCRKMKVELEKDLDLTSWKVAVVGAEPVRSETMERFAGTFVDYGFRREAFYPSYGLAESTLLVTGARGRDLPIIKRLSARALIQNTVLPANEAESMRLLVGCGDAQLGQEVTIADPVTLELCPEEIIGEVFVRGPSVARGYWNRPEESAHAFQACLANGEGPFLRTGDLGFLSEGQLFVTGRLKDLIIIRGRNLYPQDIELTAQNCHPCLRPDCGAAFTVEVEGEDSVVLVQEVSGHAKIEFDHLIAAVREAVALEHGIQIHTLVLVKRGVVPKTTSGKVMRSACRANFLAGEVVYLAISVLPVVHFEERAVPNELKRILSEAGPELRQELIESYLRSYLADKLKTVPAKISPNRPLVAMGLDSLSAMELNNLLQGALGLKLSVADFLEDLTLDDLVAAAIDQLGIHWNEMSSEKPEPSNDKPFPLSIGQQGLWMLYQLAPNSAAYNIACAARVRADLDTEALRRAFHGVMARHGALRTMFLTQDSIPFQLLQPVSDVKIHCHFEVRDLTGVKCFSLPDLLQAEAQRPFSLDKEPPVRLAVFRVAPGEHVLMLVVHHIISDLWSLDLILQDLARIYSKERNGEHVVVPEISANYADFVRWQATQIEGEQGEKHWQSWSQQLAGELPILKLPADRPRPLAQSFRGASEPMHLAPNLSSEVEKIAREHTATPFMVLLAAFQILLHRLSGQPDLLVGCPVSGRTNPDFLEVAGYFVNTIALRSSYDHQHTFLSYVLEVKRTVLNAFQHQDYPFPALVEKLHPHRVSGISPIFQAMFVWQKTRSTAGEALAAMSLGEGGIFLELGGLQLESIAIENQTSQFDLSLLMTQTAAGLSGTWKYSTDLFDKATIQRTAGHFSALLQGIVRDPRAHVSALPLLSPAERNQMVEEWSSTSSPHSPSDRCLHELFEDQAARTPQSLALVVGNSQLTYAHLNARANQFARYLRKMGVGPEVRVGICASRSVELIIAILGIWKAGGAYVPFDARDPKARLRTLMEQSSIRVIVTDGGLVDRLPDQLPPSVLLDLDLDLILQEDDENLCFRIPTESLAYVIYTSGSTGNPKGVMIEHRSVANLLSSLQHAIYDNYGVRSLRVGLNAPLAFDSSVKQLLTLTMGHTLFLVPEDVRRDGPALLDFIHKSNLEVLDCTPSQAQLLIDGGLGKTPNPVTILLGGEPVPCEMWQFLATTGSVPSYNVYGPTECTVDATVCRVDAATMPSLGRPLSGSKVYLLDEYLEPIPIGVSGEICIGGPSVGRGYLGHPDATAAKFVPDPFSAIVGSRMYRTGDRARHLPDGNIQFIGRMDRQIKIRGFRVELGEVEAALRAHPYVQDAAAVFSSTVSNGKQLRAYVVSSKDLSSGEFRQFLIERVPEYMVPSIVISLPAIPTTPNGKRDYAGLPIPDSTILMPAEHYVAPQSALEEQLAELWANVLHTKQIGVHDDFFVLGGDSLLATRLVMRIQDSFSTSVRLLPVFFQKPTIAALAQAISAENPDASAKRSLLMPQSP